eukprot:3932861-Rhodomonas_salina.1
MRAQRGPAPAAEAAQPRHAGLMMMTCSRASEEAWPGGPGPWPLARGPGRQGHHHMINSQLEKPFFY